MILFNSAAPAAVPETNTTQGRPQKGPPRVQLPEKIPGKQPVPNGARAKEIGPEIYYVPDQNGRLRPALLNEMTFEEFKRLLGTRATDRAMP